MMLQIKLARRSAWTRDQIDRFLAHATIPCRLACIGEDGFPSVTSLWFLYADGALYLSVQRNMHLLRALTRNPRCGFEIAGDLPPYHGVRGRGQAAILDAGHEPVLAPLVARYLGDREPRLARWLLSRDATEVTVKVEIAWLTAWDYRGRMSAPQ